MVSKRGMSSRHPSTFFELKQTLRNARFVFLDRIFFNAFFAVYDYVRGLFLVSIYKL